MSFEMLVAAVGYVALGLFYIANGALHFWQFRELTSAMAARRIPLPAVALTVASIFQIAAGGALAMQTDIKASAIGLAVFTVAASLIFLDFWRQSGPARKAAINTWQANLALTGALVVIGLH
ncbi:hypothetical protein [Paraburkholderia bannensis]|uniref:hypothetical protein n=1 Tax=Paraburkholderia bannensis TaxID=765414 RepID=UPI002AB20F38|nr:hypothetical protein [Paraburkholderia bannensis]